MEMRCPNQLEAIQLRKLQAAGSRKKLLMAISTALVCLLVLSGAVIQFLDLAVPRSVPFVLLALLCLAILYQIYHLFSLNLLTQCPRCSSRMTVLKGSCTQCGMYLDLNKNNQVEEKGLASRR